MSMCGVVGFDHYLSGNITQSYLNTKVQVPLAAGGTKVIDLFTPGTRLTLAYAIAPDPIENRQALKMTVVSGIGRLPTDFPWSPAGIQMPIGDSTLPRTGTWVLGCWIGSSVTRTPNGADALVGYVSYGSAQQTASLANNTGGYLEIVLNWGTGNVDIYLDGVLQTTWSGFSTSMTTPIVIGVTRYATGATNGYNWTAVGNGDYMYFRDIYFAINPTGDTNPVSRLGKSRVVAHPVASIQGNRWGTTLPSGDKVASLNTPIDGKLTPVVNSSALNDVATVKFASITPPGNYSDPLFMQVDYSVTMDTGAGVKFVHKAGTNAAVTETLVAGTMNQYVEPGLTATATTPITQDAIAALEVKINSIPG